MWCPASDLPLAPLRLRLPWWGLSCPMQGMGLVPGPRPACLSVQGPETWALWPGHAASPSHMALA